MASQDAHTHASPSNEGEIENETGEPQPQADLIYYDFRGPQNAPSASVPPPPPQRYISFSDPSSLPWPTASSSGAPSRPPSFASADQSASTIISDLARHYHQGIPDSSRRNQVLCAASENSNRIAGIRRSNLPGNIFPHIRQSGDPARYYDIQRAYNMQQPPRTDHPNHTQHFRGTMFNPITGRYEYDPRFYRPAAAEGSRAGKRCNTSGGINAGHDGGHLHQMLPSYEGKKPKHEALEHNSSNPPSQQGLHSNNGQMTISYGGRILVLERVDLLTAQRIIIYAGAVVSGVPWSKISEELGHLGVPQSPGGPVGQSHSTTVQKGARKPSVKERARENRRK